MVEGVKARLIGEPFFIKPYVGQTKQHIEKRFLQHYYSKSPLGQAMRECGIEKFTIETIERCETQKQLNEREIFWIRVLNSKQPYGYNVREGGGGYQKKFTCNSRINNFSKEKLIRLARMAIQDRLLSGKFSIEKVFNGYMAEDCFRRKILFEILIASNTLKNSDEHVDSVLVQEEYSQLDFEIKEGDAISWVVNF